LEGKEKLGGRIMNSKEKTIQDMGVKAELICQGEIRPRAKFHTHWKLECFNKDGKLKWIEEFDNIVVNVGLDDNLDKYFKGSGYTAAWYVGLKGTGTPAAGDTMASHATWSEISTEYDETTRPVLTLGAVSGQSVDNSASKAEFTFNATITIYGAFICTDNTKGGTSGTLYGVGDFTTSRAVVDDDVLKVTVTLTAASA